MRPQNTTCGCPGARSTPRLLCRKWPPMVRSSNRPDLDESLSKTERYLRHHPFRKTSHIICPSRRPKKIQAMAILNFLRLRHRDLRSGADDPSRAAVSSQTSSWTTATGLQLRHSSWRLPTSRSRHPRIARSLQLRRRQDLAAASLYQTPARLELRSQELQRTSWVARAPSTSLIHRRLGLGSPSAREETQVPRQMRHDPVLLTTDRLHRNTAKGTSNLPFTALSSRPSHQRPLQTPLKKKPRKQQRICHQHPQTTPRFRQGKAAVHRCLLDKRKRKVRRLEGAYQT